jgi:hypothetical protein
MMFKFDSMITKYESFTGKEWSEWGQNNFTYIRKNFPMVSLEGKAKAGLEDSMHEVRDWCQEHFGDNWIYDWNDFYFIRAEDASLFALRWS